LHCIIHTEVSDNDHLIIYLTAIDIKSEFNHLQLPKKAYVLAILEEKADELIEKLKYSKLYRHYIARQIEIKFAMSELGGDSQDLLIAKKVDDKVNRILKSAKTE